MKRYALSLAAFFAVSASILTIYWCGGGNFERGEALGSVVYLVICLGGLALVMTFLFSEE